MTTSFDELCKKLALTPTYAHEEELLRLEEWCDKHVSKDIHFQGTSEIRYNQYFNLAKHYLDFFLSQLPSDLSEQQPQFNNMNVIQYAAAHGYNHFITSQTSVTKEALDKADSDRMTSLHLSAAKGYLCTLCALLAKGANPTKTNKASQLPLHSAFFIPLLHDKALRANKEAIVKELITIAPETIALKDNSGNSIFHLMATRGFDGLMSTLIKDYPAGAFISNNHSHFPIHTAILNNQVDIAKRLLSIDRVATLADAKRQVALHYAARYGTQAMVEECCNASTDLNIRDSALKTPLMLAAEAANIEAVQTLIKAQANATLVDSLGYSLLHHAVLSTSKKLVAWILDNIPIDINKPDAQGHTPLYHCLEHENLAIAELLMERGAREEAKLKPR